MMPRSADTKTSNKDESQQLHLPPEAAVAANLQHLQVRRHRRSISQLMASMVEHPTDDVYRPTHYGGYVNRGYDDIDSSYYFAQFEAMAEVRGGGAALPPYASTDSDVEHGSGEADASAEDSNNEGEEVFRDCTDDAVDEQQNRCLPEFQFSLVDSEYDETLAFPDSVTILSNVGDKPVLVERKETDDDEEEFDDEENSSVVLRHEIPFTSIYGPSVKFNSFQRKVFIPGREIHVRIVDTERSVTTHLLNPNLYTIELTHGPFKWTIKRRYKHFNSLHQQLSFFRTSLNIPFPSRSHKEKRTTLKATASQMADESTLKDLSAHTKVKQTSTPLGGEGHSSKNANSNGHNAMAIISPSHSSILAGFTPRRIQKKRKKKKKRKLPRFPNRPESLVTVENLTVRIKQLEDYLYNLLNISLYRSHHETLNFAEVSNVSFVPGLGIKGKEGVILKRTGSTRPGQAGCNFFGCFQKNCCVRCNYFCSDVVCGTWRSRWFFVKETCFGYIRPTDGSIRAVILFDQGFDVSTGIYQTGMRKGLQVLTNNRHIVLKCWTRRKCKEWMQYLKNTANSYARDFTLPNPHMSFAPMRANMHATWYVDGAQYMSAVADGLEAALEEIYIADWWLSPEIYMKRPALDGDYWRLDKILLRKAEQGVRVFVLLYKEVEMALGINSYYSKSTLAKHENIKVMRHPDHARGGILLWAHHEKIVVIDQSYAFMGGIDLCYGRWDDHRHRLTDLGSISTASFSGSTRRTPSLYFSKDDTDSAFGSRKSSRNAHYETSAKERSSTPPPDEPSTSVELRTLKPGDRLLIPSMLVPSQGETPGESNIALEGMKLNTPELERKNVLDRLKNNAMKGARMGKDFMQRLTTTETAEEKTDEVYTIESQDVTDPEINQNSASGGQEATAIAGSTQILTEFCGQAKYWFGKDYSNFILKDWMNLNSPFVDIIDRTTTPRMPWHDVGLCVVGASARDVARHFIQRWNAMKLEKLRDNTRFPYLIPKSYHQVRLNPHLQQGRQQRVTCQLLRSVSAWSCGFIEADLVEQSIHDAYIQTITKAQHYVYIENQFFITMQLGMGVPGPHNNVRNQIGETLFKRIVRAHKEKKPFRVYVIMPLLPGFEGDVGGSTGIAVRAITHWNYASISRGRTAILNRLQEAGIADPQNYISFHSLRNHSFLNNTPITELIYVHSKLLIADDRVVICGSANINDRSMIGKRDSEIAAIIMDEEFEDGRMNGKKYPSGVFAGRLRKYLFKEHLGLLEGEGSGRSDLDISDPICDKFWHGTWRRISTRNTEIYDEVFKCIPTDFVKTFASLRKYQEEPPLAKTDPELAANRANEIQGYLVNLPLEFLNKEVLTPPGTSKEGLIPTSVWT
ncbi:phospholipase D2 isoform X1 [Drosophila rhopaloa]|uniref:Phospholipase n=2 Tax=Drosophila rhopaloa TaxID=1041015 RepID=A0ABM5I442_DRORH|nr:phospholipase D2 isoform X1 [Drosophila rhopaloa]XP_016989767.2 phospholipase D2 isoform X1 [Drosophila rhopaloa]XP_016989768.2 phospholipase D2 isoform X1 [Drosophila rhopaloa]XP_016989769.2 phospholipase D2 isoform X1 [Drosophila rhopaloa]